LTDRAVRFGFALAGDVVCFCRGTQASNSVVQEDAATEDGLRDAAPFCRETQASNSVVQEVAATEDGLRDAAPFCREIQASNSVDQEDATREDGLKGTAPTMNTGSEEDQVRTGPVDPSNFDFLRVLGKGGFATVFLVRKKGGADDGRLYAMKVSEKAWIIKNNFVKETMTERRILATIRDHPFVINLHYAFETGSKLCLVLDYMSGGNLGIATLGRKLDEDDVRVYIGEITLAVEGLHELGIIHRDLSLENVLLDSRGHAVISDFGLSRIFLPQEKKRTYTWCGRVKYMAPEVLVGNAVGYDMVADWWSVGVMTCELLTGQPPFTNGKESVPHHKMCSRIINDEPRIPDLSSDATDFISKLLVKDPQKRLGGGGEGAEELKRHPFFKGMDWCDLAQRKYLAPFVPSNRNESGDTDASDEFARMNGDVAPDSLNTFTGYSYTSPIASCRDEVGQLTAQSCAETTLTRPRS
jgi:ribosomal protein S6 kinase alpha-5